MRRSPLTYNVTRAAENVPRAEAGMVTASAGSALFIPLKSHNPGEVKI